MFRGNCDTYFDNIVEYNAFFTVCLVCSKNSNTAKVSTMNAQWTIFSEKIRTWRLKVAKMMMMFLNDIFSDYTSWKINISGFKRNPNNMFPDSLPTFFGYQVIRPLTLQLKPTINKKAFYKLMPKINKKTSYNFVSLKIFKGSSGIVIFHISHPWAIHGLVSKLLMFLDWKFFISLTT